jgi:hypothetical protein
LVADIQSAAALQNMALTQVVDVTRRLVINVASGMVNIQE